MKILILFAGLFCSLMANAQTFKTITVADGLPNNTIKSIVQDSLGYLWLCTFDGICRYDGHGFQIYKHENNNMLSVSHSHAETMACDDNGLWIGTNAGLDYLSFNNHVFHHYTLDGKKHDDPIFQLLKYNQHIYILDASGCLYKGVEGFQLQKCAQTNDIYQSMALYKKELLLLSTDRKMLLLNPNTGKIISEYTYKHKSEANGRQVLYYSENQDLVYLGYGIGIPSHTFRVQNNRIEETSDFVPSDLKAITDYKNMTVFGTDGKGLCVVNGDRKEFYTPLNSTISSDAIHSLYEDHDGNLWIGTYRAGLNILSHAYNNFNTLTVGGHELNYNIVTTIYADESSIYMGTDGGGLNIYDPKGDLTSFSTSNSSILGNNILSMVSDGDDLWMGIYGKGLCRFSLKNHTFQSYQHTHQGKDAFCNIWQILDDGQGNLWILDNELYLFNKKDKGFRKLSISSNGRANAILKKGNEIWMASNDGLYMMHLSHGHYSYRLFQLPGGKIQTIYVDNKNNIWYSTDQGGLRFFDRQKNKVFYWGAEVGFTDAVAVSIMEDRNNRLWIATEKGLYCYNKAKRRFSIYDKEDNVPFNQYCYHSCFCDGIKFYFGSTEGLLFFNPDKINTKTSKKVFLDKLHLLHANRDIMLNDNVGQTIKLPHDQNFFNICFSVPELVLPGKIRVVYQLEGFDKKELESSNIRDISYSNLSPGKYIFRIRVEDETDRKADHSALLTIVIAEPWWNTWWAWLLWTSLVLAIMGGVFAFYIHDRDMKSLVKQKEIEKQIQEKANKEKMNFYAGITHELRTPMFLIMAPLEEMLSSDLRPVKVPYSYLTRMYRNVQRLNKLVNHLLEFPQATHLKGMKNVMDIELVSYCKKLALDYKALCMQKNIQFKYAASVNAIPVSIDTEKLELILSNLVTNAYKYTPEGGEISLTLKNTDEGVEIQVADNGIGIAQDEQQKIFNPYYRSANSMDKEGFGIGLAFVSQLLASMGGGISIKSKISKGSKFVVRFPRSPLEEADNTATVYPAIYSGNDEETGKMPEETNIQSPTATRAILIVDDEEDILDMLERYLSNEYRVLKALNGEEGYRLAVSERPDIILCDLMMPDIDGFQLLCFLKENKFTSDIPVIMFTARDLEEDKEKAYKYGADAYITKPISIEFLRTRIESLINKRELSRQDDNWNSKLSHYSVEDQKFLLKCKEVIDNNLNNSDFDVYFFATKMNMGSSTLYKRIKSITNQSVIEFINDYRIFKSLQMLRNGETNVTKIALDCGYKNVRTFRAAFKNRMHMTPKQFLGKT